MNQDFMVYVGQGFVLHVGLCWCAQVITHLPPELQGDRSLVLEAVSKNWKAQNKNPRKNLRLSQHIEHTPKPLRRGYKRIPFIGEQAIAWRVRWCVVTFLEETDSEKGCDVVMLGCRSYIGSMVSTWVISPQYTSVLSIYRL